MENFHNTVKKKRPDNMNSIKGHPQQIHIETDDSTNPPCENNRWWKNKVDRIWQTNAYIST